MLFNVAMAADFNRPIVLKFSRLTLKFCVSLAEIDLIGKWIISLFKRYLIKNKEIETIHEK